MGTIQDISHKTNKLHKCAVKPGKRECSHF